MITSKYSKRLGFIIFFMTMALMMCGAVSAAPGNTTHDNLQLNSTNNSTQNLPDPQVYSNGKSVGTYSTISDAINAAQSGDTIMLENGGTFDEHGLTVNKNLDFKVFNNGIATINAQYKGSIFTIGNGVTVNIQNLILENGKAVNAGAILNHGTLTMNNCNFTGNTAINTVTYGYGYGGAIDNTGTLTVNSCTFNGNTVNADYGYGGAISNDKTCTIIDSTFTDNTATGDQGATGDGGAIYNKDNSLTVTGSTFNGNTAVNGGAIFNDNNAKCTVTSDTFKDNTAVNGDGGAIYNADGTLNLISSTFNGNIATNGDGGAIHNEYGTVNISDSSFTDNTAPNDDGDGGAIYNYGGTFTIKDSKFTSNYAGTDNSGGAIYNGLDLTVNDSTFTDNTATNVGGAIYSSSYNLTVTNSTLTGNTATGEGGAIYNDGGSAIIKFNRIIGNSKYDIYNTNGGSVNALYNWWGTNFVGTNPNTAKRINSGTSSWMILSISASPMTTALSGTSTVTTDLLHDNKGVYHNPTSGIVPYTATANFKTTRGSISNTSFSSGIAKSTLKAGSVAGVANVSTMVDQQKVITNIIIYPITKTDPTVGAGNVPINKVIKITFNQNIKAGSNYASITLKTSSGKVVTITKSISGNVLMINHSSLLTNGTKYILTLPAESLSISSVNFNIAYTVSFTTI